MQSIFLFGGLGNREGPPLAQLRALYAMPENAGFFAVAFDAIRTTLDYVGPGPHERHLPAGLALHDWLPGTVRPGPDELAGSIVEGVCTVVYQLCLLQQRPGRPAVASLGHSLGLYAAVVAAARLANRRALLRECHRSIVAVTLLLVRAHQVATDAADPDLAREYLDRTGAAVPPGPMATVAGMAVPELRAMLAGHAAGPDPGVVEVGLINAPGSTVLTGPAAAVLDLWSRHRERFDRPGVRWSYLEATAPFHSSLLEPAVRALDADRVFVGAGTVDLAVPVYATAPTGNLQLSRDLYGDVCRQVVCRPLDWHAVLTAAVAGGPPEAVVHFGPGPAAQVFARSYLNAAGYDLPHTVVSHRT